MTNKYCIIYYDSQRMKIEKTINIIQLLKKLVIIFKKIIELINDVQELIFKFSNDTFNQIDNIDSIKIAIFNSIKSLYDNLQILLGTQFKNIQIINYSTDNIIPKGYSINYINSLQHINIFTSNNQSQNYLNPGSTINIANTLIYINSFKILFSEEGIIKIIEYNNNLEPISVNFLGTHILKINNDKLYDKLSKCFNNNLKTINAIKIMCLNYTQKINLLQKIIK
jgi:hypothetical protein